MERSGLGGKIRKRKIFLLPTAHSSVSKRRYAVRGPARCRPNFFFFFFLQRRRHVQSPTVNGRDDDDRGKVWRTERNRQSFQKGGGETERGASSPSRQAPGGPAACLLAPLTSWVNAGVQRGSGRLSGCSLHCRPVAC